MRPLPAAAVLCLAACTSPPPLPESTPVPYPARDTRPVSSPRPSEGKITSIDLATLFELIESDRVLLFDVRPGFVQRFGTIPGAIGWPKNDFTAGLSRHEAEIAAARQNGKQVVLYCTDSACPDARTVAERLAGRGHSVSIFEGGYAEWKSSGLDG